MAIDQNKIDRWFVSPVPPPEHKKAQVEAVRIAAKHLAVAITQNTPVNADQSDSIRKVREAMTTAFASILCNC